MKVKVSVSTNRLGSESTRIIEFDKEEWDEMSEKDREETCLEIMYEMIGWDYEVVDS